MRRSSWKNTVFPLILFGLSFGYLEAAVVSYLRVLHEPARQRFYPGRPAGELFPLLTRDQVRAAGPEQSQALAIEIGREAATILMLAAMALAVSRTAGQWAAALTLAFGTWDLAFYLFLKLLLGWPASWFDWDILFLIPVPWVGPVAAPVSVSAAMIASGLWHLRAERAGEPVRVRGWLGAGIFLGAVLIIGSFVADSRNILAGGMPRSFRWDLFWTGLGIGVLSYARAASKRRQASN